jgi:hypothetical protein
MPIDPKKGTSAHTLLERLAAIAGLGDPSWQWPSDRRFGHEIIQKWLSAGWSPELWEAVAVKTMMSKRDGPPDSP